MNEQKMTREELEQRVLEVAAQLPKEVVLEIIRKYMPHE